MNQPTPPTKYTHVRDHLNREIPRLWKRAKLYYIQTRVPGKKSPKKFPLLNPDGSRPETVPQAKAAAEAFMVAKRAGNTPVPKSAVQTVRDICQRYLDEGCPCRDDRRQRAGRGTEAEIFRVKMLLAAPLADIPAASLTAKDWERYSLWRKKHLHKTQTAKVKGRGGDRAVDKDRVTLSNAYRRAIWHSDETGITMNQVTALNFKRYRDPRAVVHCRNHKPIDGDELHMIARHAFESGPSTEVLGWFCLFTARIGHRAAAMITLRTDAKRPVGSQWPEPGYVAERDGIRNIYLFRSESSKGTVGHLLVDAEFDAMLKAHSEWLKRRHPNSPYYFPSPTYTGQPMRVFYLTQWLAKICPKLGIGHRTTHGLRSFRTTCLRSQGKSAAECAELLGQKTAGSLVLDVYGEQVDYKVDWMPSKGEPAWKFFERQPPANVVMLEQAG